MYVQENMICTSSGNGMYPKIDGQVSSCGLKLLGNPTSRSYAADAVFVALAVLLEFFWVSGGMTRSPIIPSRSTCA